MFCKGSVKFRLSEKNTNKFAFLSVRNIFKPSEKPKKNHFIYICYFKKLNATCNFATLQLCDKKNGEFWLSVSWLILVDFVQKILASLRLFCRDGFPDGIGVPMSIQIQYIPAQSANNKRITIVKRLLQHCNIATF